MSGCQSSEISNPLRYGGLHDPEEYILLDEDFWSPRQVQVDHVLFSSPTECLEALRGGAAEIILASDIHAAKLFSESTGEYVIISVSESGNRYATIVPRESRFYTWDDLKGKRVAVVDESGVK